MLAFHAIMSAYGFWLPNDPRGSWSDYVGSWELFRFGGEATKVGTTLSVATRPHNHELRLAAKTKLKYPAVSFNGEQARSIASGFRSIAEIAGYHILALAILSEHIHAVIGATQRDPGRVMGHLKRGATDCMIQEGIHPCWVDGRLTHSCWAKQAWKVFLDTEEQLDRAIRYVEDNPVKEGKRRQQWSFVGQHRKAFWKIGSGGASPPANADSHPATISRSWRTSHTPTNLIRVRR